jgi:hypothetical protein
MLECCCTLTAAITTGASREVHEGKKVNLCFIIVYSTEDYILKIQMGMLLPILSVYSLSPDCLGQSQKFGAVEKVTTQCDCPGRLGGHSVVRYDTQGM